MKVILDNQLIESLFLNNKLLEAFPFLKEVAHRKKAADKAGSKCPPCQKAGIIEEYNNIKAAIAHMSEEKRNEFKRITGFKQVKVVFKAGNTTDTISF